MEIELCIDTYARTIGEISGASTSTAGAELAAGAFGIAFSAVIEVTIGIDTGARASGLSGGA
jgi:hypothetical protein